MKLTLQQKQRLAVLLVAAAALTAGKSLEAAEQTELTSLKSLYEVELTAEGKTFDEAEFVKEFAATSTSVTESELDAAITKAINTALAGKTVDTATIVTDLKAAFGAGNLKVEDIEAAVKKHVSLPDTATLVSSITAAVKSALPASGITKAELDAAFDAFTAKQAKSAPVHQFPVFGGHAPVEHRSGNMTVAQKQLLNLCLGGMTDEQLDKTGAKRPSGINDGIRESDLIAAKRAGDAHVKAVRNSVVYGAKALTTTGSGNGAELVSTDLSSDLQARMYLESQLASALIASEIEMPSDPFKFPLKTTRTQFYVGSQNPGSNPTASNPGTANPTLTTAKLIGMAEYSYEVDEDAVIAMLPTLQEDMAAGAAYSFELAVLNGDSDGTHHDSDFEAITDHAAKAFNGVRKLALAQAATKIDLSTGGISAANIRAMRKLLKTQGIRPRDLLLVVGTNGYNDIVGLDETLTFDKVGSAEAARILTGTAGSIFGMPIIVSDCVRENLNASGVYDGTTTTKGSIYLIHRPSWMVGVKRGFTVELDVDKKKQMNYVIASFRRAFTPREALSTTPSAVVGYNFTA